MDLREHVFYHELLSGKCSLSDAVRTFEKVLGESDPNAGLSLKSTAEVLAKAQGGKDVDGPDSAERYYGALLTQAVFSKRSDHEVRDLINLAQKEAIARQITLLLHTGDVKLRDVEEALVDFAALPVGESQVSTNISIGIRVQLISSFISDNLFYVGVAKFHITMRDVDALLRRVVGKYGQKCRIGGKSAGMILANRILKPVFGESTGYEDRIEEVESYYLTAQVFNQFIEHNKLEEGHALKYLEVDEQETSRQKLEPRFQQGHFPDEIAVQIRDVFQRLGPCPLIVRSSSLLEDSMGFPFYGKYDSVFVCNNGTVDERYEEFLAAIKTVYVSILSSSVIEYRKDKNLLDYEDMMSVLIQQVVGERHGKYYFPETAGVAFSRNQYCWSQRIDPSDGVARMVHGLGTRAVDRGGDDYPRLVSLGQPGLRPEGSLNEKLKYSQRYVDVLNLESGRMESVHFIDLYNYIRETGGNNYKPSHAISLVSEDRFVSSGIYPDQLNPGEAAVTFEGLLNNTGFPETLRGATRILEEAYGVPVDVEFACNADRLYILQCRPLADWKPRSGNVSVPSPAIDQRRLFETSRDVFRGTTINDIRYVVYVDAEQYGSLSTDTEKLETARVVGRINRALKGERFIIMGPGRWGSVNLSLGVKVNYGDINNTLLLAEIAFERGGYRPELSYGTHFFQDLIEADIIPLALFPGEHGSLDLDFFTDAPNATTDVLPPGKLPEGSVADAVKLVDLDTYGAGRLSVHLDAASNRGIGLLG